MIKTIYPKKIAALLISVSCMYAANIYAASKTDEYASYCRESGGVVEKMPAEISTSTGIVTGQSKMFCNFNVHDGFIAIGLETFASAEPSIAATFIKQLDEIKEDSALWEGNYANPAHNVCKNLGGSTIGFVANGGFANELGQSDICIFGDGSMVSAWSIIYMTNHRDGYDAVKDKVKAEPLNIYIPH